MCNEWTNAKCYGSVPTPRGNHASTIISHGVWTYGGEHSSSFSDEFYKLDLKILTWTQIQISQPKPPELVCCSLNVISDTTLLLYGGASVQLPGHSIQTLDGMWIFDVLTNTWRQYTSSKDHHRGGHRGTPGLNKCVIVIGGAKDPEDSYDDYTTTFHVMLAPKSLQQVALQTVFKHRAVLSWTCLPLKLKTLLEITDSE